MMTDRLVIADLEASCRLGVTEEERRAPQPVWVDLECPVDASRAARRDDVDAAVDYARLVAEVRRFAQAQPFQLLETVADGMAAMILENFRVPSVVVRVKKRALPGLGYAAVEVERPLKAFRLRGRPERAKRVEGRRAGTAAGR